MSQGFLTGGEFAGVARGEHIKIATIDNIADDEIGGDFGDIIGDVSCDDFGIVDEFCFALRIFYDATIPGNHAKKTTASAFVGFICGIGWGGGSKASDAENGN